MENNSPATVTTFQAARDFLLAHEHDPEAACRDFRWPVLEHFNWALDWFDGVLAQGPTRDDTALCISAPNGETRLSFAELSARSNQVANHLRLLGVRRGERILVMLGNVVPLWETLLAAMKLGAVVTPATPQLTSDDLADRIRRGRVRHIVASAEVAHRFDGIDGPWNHVTVGDPPRLGWSRYEDARASSAVFIPDRPTLADHPLLLYFTSGTTALPKPVLHTHRSYPIGHLSTMYWLGLRPGDRHLNISSPGWAKHAWSSFFAPWNAGATVVVVQQERSEPRPPGTGGAPARESGDRISHRFEAVGMLETMKRLDVTTLCAPPTVWRLLVQQDLTRWKLALRTCASAGEPLNAEIIERIQKAWNLTVRDGYGQTETTALIGNPPRQPIKPGSMGKPLPGYRVALLDAEGHEGAEGEICLSLEGDARPAALMRGYLEPSGAITEVPGPYYRTGDIAMRDADGYLTFVGRTDDVFKASDYRISPFELESVLIEHPDVVEAAVVPSPDPLRLAVPKAFVTLRAEVDPNPDTAASIFSYLRSRLAPYKRIRRIEFCDLPKTLTGKIRRGDLRRAEAAKTAPAAVSAEEFEDPEGG